MKVFVGVYWSARREDLLQCTSRLESHFATLAKASEHLFHWYRGGHRRPTLGALVNTGAQEVLADLLQRGVNRKDSDRQIMPELGFRVGLWNGGAGGLSAGTSVTCGLYSKSKNLLNVANLNIEAEEHAAPSPAVMIDLLQGLIEVWGPESGKVEQRYMPPYEGDEIPEGEDIPYASYWTSGKAEPGATGMIVPCGSGRLWVSANATWRTPSV